MTADDDARLAAAAAGVRVAEVGAVDALHDVAALFATIWRTSLQDPPLNSDLLRALAHIGGYVAAAWDATGLVGASVGLLADDRGRLGLHSHISGVSSAAQGRGAGYALKLHQRAWAITHGIGRVTWTFDPLVRRNARFNLTKLGATAVAYHDNFYGAMHDGVNRDDESDRCSASWEVSGPKAAAAAGAVAAEDPEHGDAAIVLQADGAGAPVVTASSAGRRVCWIPPDIVAMRAVDPGAARAWRMALRATLGAAMEAGLVGTAMTRSGWYVLERP